MTGLTPTTTTVLVLVMTSVAVLAAAAAAATPASTKEAVASSGTQNYVMEWLKVFAADINESGAWQTISVPFARLADNVRFGVKSIADTATSQTNAGRAEMEQRAREGRPLLFKVFALVPKPDFSTYHRNDPVKMRRVECAVQEVDAKFHGFAPLLYNFVKWKLLLEDIQDRLERRAHPSSK